MIAGLLKGLVILVGTTIIVVILGGTLGAVELVILAAISCSLAWAWIRSSKPKSGSSKTQMT